MNWLNGKKTIIGATLLFGSTLLSAVIVGIWEIEQWWIPNTIATLDWTGMAVAGTGLGHKYVKAGKET